MVRRCFHNRNTAMTSSRHRRKNPGIWRNLLLLTLWRHFGDTSETCCIMISPFMFARADIPDLFPDILCEPATDGDLAAIYAMAADYFGPEISPLDLMLAWQRKNHTSFRVLIEKRQSTFATSRKIVGYYCVLPVRKTAYDRLISGKMTGSATAAEDIVLPRYAPYAVYLGGMAATGFRARGGLLMAIRMDIDAAWSGRVKRFLTRPVTAQGLRLVSHHGFTPVDASAPGVGALYHRVEV